MQERINLYGIAGELVPCHGKVLDFLLLKGSMKGLLSYCGMIAELEDTFHCRVDLVVKSAIKDEKFLEEVDRDEVKLYG